MASGLTRGGFVDLLIEEFGCRTDLELGEKLRISPANWRAKAGDPVSKSIVKHALNAIRRNLMSGCIESIAEFHYLDILHGHGRDTFRRRVNDEDICKTLEASQGVYAFYDTQGEIIYCGKTVGNNLLSEMGQAYKLKRTQYKRRFALNGEIRLVNLKLIDTAAYFSAYCVDPDLISNLEAFVIRIAPNNLINRKIEKIKVGRV
jgi:hypothetical protein